MSTSHPFDRSGWPYAHTSEWLTLYFGSDAASNLRHRGGKAFGLQLCERLAKHDQRLRVPFWQVRAVQPGPVLALSSEDIDRDFLLRSNALDEDWCSGESGEHRTYLHREGEETVRVSLTKPRQFVEQDYIWGVGLIVDIGWSDITDSVVGRVSCGRVLPETGARELSEAPIWRERPDGKRYFCTSATEDADGPSVAWTLGEQTKQITWNSGRGQNRACEDLPLEDLVIALYQALQAEGIDFGVQLELRIDPDEPDVWHLVQVRPTPDATRGHWHGVWRGSEMWIATTCVVSGSFEHYGNLALTTPDLSTTMHRPDWQTAIAPTVKGKILRFIGLQRPAGVTARARVERLAALMPSAIITSNSLGNNTQHYALCPQDRATLEATRALARATPIMTISEHELGIMGGFLPPTNLRLFSDGLIGRIHLL